MKLAYLTLIIAATLAFSQVVLDLVGGSQPSAARSVLSDPNDVSSLPRSGRETYRPDPAVADRIDNILQQPALEVPARLETDVSPVALPVPDAGTATPLAQNVPEFPADGVTAIRQQTPLHKKLLTPGNFLYLGGFRTPHVDQNGTEFYLGGCGMTFREDGDPSGPADGFSGSLYIVGNHTKQLVAEISIPQPVISQQKIMEELPEASVLQQFGDITGGIRSRLTAGSSEPFEVGGMQFTNGRLHWTVYKYYNVDSTDYLSHGRSSRSIANPNPEGLWHLGPIRSGISAWHSYKHAGYIFEIPAAAQHWFGGRNLISGLQICTGLNIASHGPAMFAYRLPPSGTAHGTSLDAVPLVFNDINRPAPGYNPADRWAGGAWLTLGQKHAVIIVGRKSLGPVYYGQGRAQDCEDVKGYHGGPYEAQMLFYSPETLHRSASHAVEPQQVVPAYHWKKATPGGGFNQYLFPTCSQQIGGVSYDRKNNLLYVCQVNAGTTAGREYEVLPVIHVFRIVE